MPIDTAALRALADAATPGPWTSFGSDGGYQIARVLGLCNTAPTHMTALDYHDALFVPAARTAVPQMCDELDTLRAQIATSFRMYTVEEVRALWEDGKVVLEDAHGKVWSKASLSYLGQRPDIDRNWTCDEEWNCATVSNSYQLTKLPMRVFDPKCPRPGIRKQHKRRGLEAAELDTLREQIAKLRELATTSPVIGSELVLDIIGHEPGEVTEC